MIAALLLSLLLQAAAPAATPPPAGPGPVSAEDSGLLFLFFRLRYFHDAAEVRRCLRADPERTRAFNARYEALRARLSARLGAAHVDFRGSGNSGPERGDEPDCRLGMTLAGYGNALNELERRLPAGAR